MTNTTSPKQNTISSPYVLSHVPPDELISALKRLVGCRQKLTARLLAHIGEVDARKLYARSACPSMFAYCTEVLHLSEGAAYKRIHAARAARKHPVIYEYVASGRLHLAAVCLLAPHLTAENRDELLNAASGRTKRNVENLLAERFPSPDVPARVRALPRPKTGTTPGSSFADPSPPRNDPHSLPARPLTTSQTQLAAATPAPKIPPPRLDVMAPLSERRYKIQFTSGRSLHDKLREAQDLLGHRAQSGDLAEVFERALDLLLRDLRKKRFAVTDRPRKEANLAESSEHKTVSDSRHIPNAVKRKVAERDGYQCAFVDPETGRRCPARSNLEFHHVIPRAMGGRHDPSNLRLACRTHNLHAARQDFGEEFMRRRVKGAGRQSVADRRTEDNCPRGQLEPPAVLVRISRQDEQDR